MAHEHSHTHADMNEKALRWALALTTGYLIAEVVGGVLAGSLALISDAAHMFTDAAALAIALVAIRIGKRPADQRRTFGYYRFEILAAALNAVLLFLVALYILYEAYRRLESPPNIESGMMLGIATIGLAVNLLSMRLLSSGKDESLNVKGAYLEVWSDMLGSIGVIVGALVIRYTDWTWVDSLIAVGIGLWVVPRTWRLLRESLNVLLEGVPEGMGLKEIDEAIRAVPGVASVHDLHLWSISSGKPSLTVHVVSTETAGSPITVMERIRGMLAERFSICHSTVQMETRACEQSGDSHSYQTPHEHSDEHRQH